jgi:hypothetical protein
MYLSKLRIKRHLFEARIEAEPIHVLPMQKRWPDSPPRRSHFGLPSQGSYLMLVYWTSLMETPCAPTAKRSHGGVPPETNLQQC